MFHQWSGRPHTTRQGPNPAWHEAHSCRFPRRGGRLRRISTFTISDHGLSSPGRLPMSGASHSVRHCGLALDAEWPLSYRMTRTRWKTRRADDTSRHADRKYGCRHLRGWGAATVQSATHPSSKQAPSSQAKPGAIVCLTGRTPRYALKSAEGVWLEAT